MESAVHTTNENTTGATKPDGSKEPEEKVWSWSDEAFKSIIDAVLASNRAGGITDISSPPGTKKTLMVIRYILENNLDAVASFPTHQNQRTALHYILSTLEKTKVMRLKQFVVDYAGLENYCLFYRPELLMELLDRFKTSPNESYRDAVQNLLANDVFFRILLAKDVADVDEIWYMIAEALDEYARTKDRKGYLSQIKTIVEKKGQYEVCTSFCPLGLFAWWWRKELYKFFSEPKIITWRKIKDEAIASKFTHVSRFIVHANPENFVKNIGKLLSGEFKPEWVLCPRYILMTKISMSPKSSRPTFIAARKSIILTPHAGLDFVLTTVKRQVEITRVKRRHILFLDEYDTLLRPKTWPVVSIEVARTMVAVAEKILSADIGDIVYGVEVDEYLKRYAEYVKDVLSEVISLFEEATESGAYHPIVNVFLEGAFSRYRETTLKTKREVEYLPLGARVVHIKHFLARDGGRLLFLILNPKLYFYDLAERDRDWVVKYREALVKFRSLLKEVKSPARFPVWIKQKQMRLLYLSMREAVLGDLDVLRILRDYLSPLLIAPRYAVYYTGEPSRTHYKTKLASVDVNIYKLLTWSKSAILVSATPVHWNAYVAGSNPESVAESEYQAVVNDVVHSLVSFEPPVSLHYENREETRYVMHIMLYTKDFQKVLEESLKTGRPINFAESTSRAEITITQTSPRTSRVKQYTDLLRIQFLTTLKPIQQTLKQAVAGTSGYVPIVEALRDYLSVIGHLYARGFNVLVLVQNKRITKIIKDILGAVPCIGEVCGKDVDESKLSHYIAKKRIVITYFRSRATRGVDIPHNLLINAVVVVGSPYPRPTVIAHYKSDAGLSPYSSKYYIPLSGIGYNTNIFTSIKTLVARDFMNGVAELVQAVGRAIRSVMKTGNRVLVVLPQYLQQRVMAFAPYWFRNAVKGVLLH